MRKNNKAACIILWVILRVSLYWAGEVLGNLCLCDLNWDESCWLAAGWRILRSAGLDWAGWCQSSPPPNSAGYTAHAWPRTVQSVLGHTRDRFDTSAQWLTVTTARHTNYNYIILTILSVCAVMVGWCAEVVRCWCCDVMCSPLLGANLALADVNSGQLDWQSVVQHCETHSYIMIK